MTRIKVMLNILAVSVVCLVCGSVAHAQATRTWVSGVGDDANPCSRTAPCKTFAGAISKTAAGGEISVLDPGGYGAVTITKAITIDGGTGSGWASILAAGTNGVIINAGVNDVITLRNLSINGVKQTTSPGLNGIRFLAGASLHVENCVIFGFGTHGIDINRTTGANATIQDTTIEEMGGSGLNVTTTTGVVGVAMNNVQILKTTTGVAAATGAVVTIRNSALSFNTTGVATTSTGVANINDNVFASNGTGVSSAVGTTIRVNNNSFANNGTAINNAGTGQSATNNKFMGNPTNVAGNALGGGISIL